MHVPDKNLMEYRHIRSIVHAMESLQDFKLSQYSSIPGLSADIKKYRAMMDELREKPNG